MGPELTCLIFASFVTFVSTIGIIWVKRILFKLRSRPDNNLKCKMVLEKDPEDDKNLDIGLEFVLNPESAHPTSVFMEAELEDGEIAVVGRAEADSKTKSTADIEVELRRDGEIDYDDVHLDVIDNVTDSDELELEVEGSLRRIDMRRKESTSKTTTVRKKREVTNELDCVLTLEKDPLDDKKLDIDLEFTLNPESKKATTVELEVELNANEMEIHGTADSLGKAIADIEVEFKRDDKIDHDDIHLEVTKNEHDSDDMELEIEAEKARKKRVVKKLPVKRKPSKPKPKPPVTKAKPKVPPSGPKKTTKPRSKSRSVSRKPSPRRTRSQSNNSKPKKPASKKPTKATPPKISNKNARKPSRSPHKSKNFHPDKKKTIKSIEIEKNITKGKPDGKGKEAKTDVDTILYVEKHPISDKLDIDLDVVIDKDSKKPMTVNVEAQLDNEKATVEGKAKGKEKGKAMIDTEVHHSDYYEHHHDKARDRNIMDLNIEKKDKAAKGMELNAREDTPIQVSNAEANKDHAKFKKKKPSRSESADSKGSKPSRSSSKSKNTKVRTVSSDTDEEDPQPKKKTQKSQKKTKK